MAMYPGVHIFENTRLSLASDGMSGLRPLLVGRFFNLDGTERSLAAGVLNVDSWLSFSEACLASSLFIVVDETGSSIIGTEPPDDNLEHLVAAESSPKTRAKKSQLTDKNFNSGVFALRHYFDNGGGPCLLLSYGADDELTDIVTALAEYDEISLLALIDAEAGDINAINTELDKVITNNQQAFLITRHASAATPTPVRGSNAARTATYTPDLTTSYDYALDDSGILIQRESSYGSSPISLAELRNSPLPADKVVADTVDRALAEVVLPPEAQVPVILSPCAAVAGAYCRSERQVGIWKAPANIPLVGAVPEVLVEEQQHGELNEVGINVITWHPRAGTSIMGARTLEDINKTAWRYVPVRLLFNTVERDLRSMMTPVIFEPNSLATWQQVRSGIESYLYDLWKKGGLYGTSPEQAYVVNIGPETMSEADIENGVLRARIGLAALRPAEFIFLEFTQDVHNLALK
ncbi:Phage tail sheath protein [compost metagenome]